MRGKLRSTIGFTVLGPDYFFGDYFTDHSEPDFDRSAWRDKSFKQAEDAVPKWLEEVREKYGECLFNLPLSLRQTMTQIP